MIDRKSFTAALMVASATLGGCATTWPPVPAAQIQRLTPGTYDAGNPFARILRGEIPAVKVYEDAQVVAFMDRNPVQTGHVLVISKSSHARNLLEIAPRDLDRLLLVARRIGQAEMIGLGATGFTIEQNNGSAQTVFHLHVHVIPRYRDEKWSDVSGPAQTPSQLEPIAAKIRAALPAE